MIVSVTKRDFFFSVEKDDGKTYSVPDDLNNPDRQELEEWIKAEGEVLSESPPPMTNPSVSSVPNSYNWSVLAIQFEMSQLNQVLARLMDESTNPLISPIWRISDTLARIVSLPVSSESDREAIDSQRIAGLTYNIQALYEKLAEGKVNVPESASEEILKILRDNGFESVAETLSRSSVS